jgi:magnesium-protoporphyrin O-methyltransferase
LLRDGLAAARLTSGTVLDVGAGVGSLTLALLDQGMARGIQIEASAAYLAAASEEAARRGRSAIVQFVHGDYVTVGPQVPGASVVTLDRVVCCYPLFEPLLEQAGHHAERSVALSYPRDRWFVRVGLWFENLLRRLKGNPFRTFLHSPTEMQQLLERCGFELVSRSQTPAWAADVFVRHSRLGGNMAKQIEPSLHLNAYEALRAGRSGRQPMRGEVVGGRGQRLTGTP